MDLAFGVALLVVSIMTVVRSVLTPTALGWSVAGFALLGLMMSEPVWRNWFDAARALAPVVTGFVLVVAASSRASSGMSSRRSIDPTVRLSDR
jgi:hypothetical protein